MNSELMLFSNLMIDDDEHKPEYRFLPGDYIGRVYPEKVDRRANTLSENQRLELEMYLTCLRCGRTCAGTCMDRFGSPC